MTSSREKYKNRVIKNIKFYRKELGWTQEKLSEELGIHPVSVRRYENGNRDISLNMLLKIAEVFNIPPGKFFD